MGKFKTTNYVTRKEILKFPDHYVNLAITVDDAGIVADADGRKIVPAGTLMGGGVIDDATKKSVPANDATSEGVLFYDVDVTYGPAAGALLIHGFIDVTKIPAAPSADAVTALPMIKFIGN